MKFFFSFRGLKRNKVTILFYQTHLNIEEICFVFGFPVFASLSSDNNSININFYLKKNTFRHNYAFKHKLQTVTADWSTLMVRIT